MNTYLEKFRLLSRKRSFKYGVPFLIVVVGGSFALKQFTVLRYEYSKNKTLTSEEAKKFGIDMKKAGEVTLETEYEKIKELDIHNWEQKRGPRPWET